MFPHFSGVCSTGKGKSFPWFWLPRENTSRGQEPLMGRLDQTNARNSVELVNSVRNLLWTSDTLPETSCHMASLACFFTENSIWEEVEKINIISEKLLKQNYWTDINETIVRNNATYRLSFAKGLKSKSLIATEIWIFKNCVTTVGHPGKKREKLAFFWKIIENKLQNGY